MATGDRVPCGCVPHRQIRRGVLREGWIDGLIKTLYMLLAWDGRARTTHGVPITGVARILYVAIHMGGGPIVTCTHIHSTSGMQL